MQWCIANNCKTSINIHLFGHTFVCVYTVQLSFLHSIKLIHHQIDNN